MQAQDPPPPYVTTAVTENPAVDGYSKDLLLEDLPERPPAVTTPSVLEILADDSDDPHQLSTTTSLHQKKSTNSRLAPVLIALVTFCFLTLPLFILRYVLHLI